MRSKHLRENKFSLRKVYTDHYQVKGSQSGRCICTTIPFNVTLGPFHDKNIINYGHLWMCANLADWINATQLSINITLLLLVASSILSLVQNTMHARVWMQHDERQIWRHFAAAHLGVFICISNRHCGRRQLEKGGESKCNGLLLVMVTLHCFALVSRVGSLQRSGRYNR